MTAVTAATAEPLEAQPLLRRLSPPLVLAGGVLVASVALHVRDPHQQGAWGFCPWLLLTGTYCPGCGGLRAVNDLTRGDVGGALSSNALFVVSLPALALMWARSVQQRWRGRLTPMGSRWIALWSTVALSAILVFWVVRNLPFAAALTP